MLKHATPSRTASLVLTAMLSSLAFAASAAPAADTQQVGPGQRYYEKTCAKCHETGIGPVLKGRGFPAITYVVIARNGYNAMPAFRVTDIDDATLQNLGEYLASTNPPVSK